MTQPIILAFHPDGDVEFTRTSKFTPFEGRGDMERVTDIRKFSESNLYYIDWLLGPYKGMAHTVSMAKNYNVPVPSRPDGDNAISAIITFGTYEGAVQHEIQVLNAMRKAGVKFYEQEKASTS